MWPHATGIEPANEDLSDDIKRDYDEAASIVRRSPRGAAAILRLAVQKLCIQLGGKGKDLNTDIATLVEGGLPKVIQKSLDIVRVIGNNAVHPGELDLKDDLNSATTLFKLLNSIAEDQITRPKEITAIYSALPQGPRDAIEKRDNVAKPAKT